MKAISVLMAIVFTATLIGCTQQERDAGTGALIGAGVGAIIGHQSGEEKEGAAIGAAVGALAGYTYSKMKQSRTEQGELRKYVDCPNCKETLYLPAEAEAGDVIRCQNCGTEFGLQ